MPARYFPTRMAGTRGQHFPGPAALKFYDRRGQVLRLPEAGGVESTTGWARVVGTIVRATRPQPVTLYRPP